jgi:hypothetical protein
MAIGAIDRSQTEKASDERTRTGTPTILKTLLQHPT